MTLFHFNPNTYGQQWFVMAESRDAAIEAVRAHIRAEVAAMTFWDNGPDDWPADDPRHCQTAEQKRAEQLDDEMRRLDAYVNETPWLARNRPPCIEAVGAGQVIAAEIS